MLESLLSPADTLRVSHVLGHLKSAGLAFAVTGGLAIGARLRERGVPVAQRPLNDLDIVVHAWSALEGRVADGFLMNHIHPMAPEGKLLLQLVSPDQKLRVDVFRAYGLTLGRASHVASISDWRFVSAEDLRARVTAHVCRSLERGTAIDQKYVDTFFALSNAGEPQLLAEAWSDHRESICGTIWEASAMAQDLLSANPQLVVKEHYGLECGPCAKCQPDDGFVLADRELVGSILGYT